MVRRTMLSLHNGAAGCLDMDVLMPRAHGRAGAATSGITLRFGVVATKASLPAPELLSECCA
ncbi:MAG: hypothetical protein AB7E31_02735 [Desulfitobacterium sp.]